MYDYHKIENPGISRCILYPLKKRSFVVIVFLLFFRANTVQYIWERGVCVSTTLNNSLSNGFFSPPPSAVSDVTNGSKPTQEVLRTLIHAKSSISVPVCIVCNIFFAYYYDITVCKDSWQKWVFRKAAVVFIPYSPCSETTLQGEP